MAASCNRCAVEAGSAAAELDLHIDRMDCPTEQGLIRKRPARIDGIERLETST